jgi:hypothetical protein
MPLDVACDAAKAAGIHMHVSERFLRDKDGDPLGRPIPDYSHSAFGTAPNHQDLKSVVADKWGQVTHPDIADVCRAYLTARASAPQSCIWGSRVDVKAAYTRVLIRPPDAPTLATLVSDDHPEFGSLVSIPIVNQWGSQPAGHAYEIPGRALTRRADARTAVQGHRTGVTYVDDRIQFGPKHVLESEIDAFSADAREALGSSAVNAAKTTLSTAFDTIGWRFNTIEGTVSPSPRAVMKLIYIFNVATPPETKAGSPVKVRHLQRLSALAIRYSLAIVPLRPFSAAFAKNAGGPLVPRGALVALHTPTYWPGGMP